MVGRRTRAIAATLAFTFVLYHAHRILQLQYYRHCKSDLFRVVMFHQSTMCTQVAGVLQVVEIAYHQVFKQITSHVLSFLTGGIGTGPNGGDWLGRVANAAFT
jgi:hypothetical protein